MPKAFCELTQPDYAPTLRALRLPQLISLFPVTRVAARRAVSGTAGGSRGCSGALSRGVCSLASIILDVGAGRGAPPAIALRGQVKRVIGVDVADDIEQNPNLDERHVGSVAAMPFLADASIDLAFARYVAEHLERPLDVLAELRRVLRPGGRFLFITPNRRHYVPALASRLGLGMHRALNALRGRPEVDTIFPTVYALNTPEDITRLAHGRRVLERRDPARSESQPNYLTFHPGVFAAGVLYERIVNSSQRAPRSFEVPCSRA